ncbi:MAG: hypothetical protein ACW97V_16165 [Promethearchaeota archaeon]|jgi:hypothetical protein
MEKFSDDKKKIKVGKKYLTGGVYSSGLGLILLISSFSLWESIMGSNFQGEGPLIIVVIWAIMTLFFFIGFFYFFWGLSKLRKAFEEISNIYKVIYGTISFILGMLLILYGFLSSIWCSPTICTFRLSVVQIVTLPLGVILLISGLTFLRYELRKIKGTDLGDFLAEQKKKSVITPISKALYKIRIEKIGGQLEKNHLVCGKCGVRNSLEKINDKIGFYRCLNCGSENYIDK